MIFLCTHYYNIELVKLLFYINKMNDFNKYKLFRQLARQGVLHRNQVLGYGVALAHLQRAGLVVRVPKRRRVYYELTPRALEQVEKYRQQLVKKLETQAALSPRSTVYRALLEDIRFLNKTKPEAQEFMLLGDWQLTLPVRKNQLRLAQYRFYEKEGLI